MLQPNPYNLTVTAANVTGPITAGSIATPGTVVATGAITGGSLVTAGSVSTSTVTASGAVTGALTCPTPTGTLLTGTGVTLGYTNRNNSFIHRISIDYRVAQTAALTRDVTLFTMPPRCRILRIVWDCTTPFVGTLISAATMAVGSAAGGAQLLTAANLLVASTRGIVSAEYGSGINNQNGYNSWAGGGIVNLRFTSVGANLSALTAGAITFYIDGVVYP